MQWQPQGRSGLTLLPSTTRAHNNQYMVVDLKLFRPGQELQAGTLWVVEQLPGLSIAGDQTQVRLTLFVPLSAKHHIVPVDGHD